MNCKNLKQKLNRTLYCKYKKRDIRISECSNCIYKKYRNSNQIKKTDCYRQNISKKVAKNSKKGFSNQIKKRTNKLAKMERERFSIFTEDLDHCIICKRKKDNLHEVFFGRNRLNSIKYGLVIPLCIECHEEIHKNIQWQNRWHKKGQTKFKEVYPDLNFVDIFKKNY